MARVIWGAVLAVTALGTFQGCGLGEKQDVCTQAQRRVEECGVEPQNSQKSLASECDELQAAFSELIMAQPDCVMVTESLKAPEWDDADLSPSKADEKADDWVYHIAKGVWLAGKAVVDGIGDAVGKLGGWFFQRLSDFDKYRRTQFGNDADWVKNMFGKFASFLGDFKDNTINSWCKNFGGPCANGGVGKYTTKDVTDAYHFGERDGATAYRDTIKRELDKYKIIPKPIESSRCIAPQSGQCK